MKNKRNIFKEYREKKNFTQEELAEKVGLSTRQIQRLEYKESETKIETLRKLIDILEIEDKDIIAFIKGEK